MTALAWSANPFTNDDKRVIFNFHAYPWLIHRLTYRRPAQHHHVPGDKERGNINAPGARDPQPGRPLQLAIDAIDRMEHFRVTGSRTRR